MKKNYPSLSAQRSILWILFIVLVFGLLAAHYTHEEKATVVVRKVDMQQVVSGGGDSSVSTSYHFMVYTDNGIYEVNQSGLLFARPELVGRIHEGDTLTITSRGYNLPQISTYRKIIEIYQKNQTTTF